VRLIEPVGYFDMLALEGACDFVVTDSGGVQKEAYFFRKPCMTLRDSTEWVELVETGSSAPIKERSREHSIPWRPQSSMVLSMARATRARRYVIDFSPTCKPWDKD